MNKKTLLFPFVAALMLVVSSCSPAYQSVDSIKKNGQLVVATNAEFAPFEYIQDNAFTGIDMDIINAYAKYLGVNCKIDDQDFDAALLAVSTNKANVAIAAITKNEKREKTMSFSDPYFEANQVVIVKSDSVYASLTTETEILSALTANKAKIGVQVGTTGQYYVEGDADWDFPGITGTTCVTYPNGGLAAKALSNGQADAVIIDVAPANIFCKNISGIKVLDVVLTSEEYAIAVGKGNKTLIESLNEFIKTIKTDGTFDNIVSKYFGEE